MTSAGISSKRPSPAGRQLGLVHLIHRQPLVLPATLFIALLAVMIWLMGEAISVTLLSSLLQTTLPLVIVGLGQTLVILTGGIDLAVGGIMSLSTALFATQMTQDADMIVWLPLTLAIGFGIGFLDGFVIVRTRIQPFIVTLASWSVLSGIALLMLPTQGGAVAPSLIHFAFDSYFGAPSAVWITLAVILLWAIIRRTRFGTAVYAIGSNETAAGLNGLRVGRSKMLVYGISGLTAALAGLYFAALTDSGSSVAGDPFILRSVAAVVIGGTSLAGGRGGFIGTVLGALSLSFITQIVFFSGAESGFTLLFQGLLLVAAIVVYSIVEIVVERRSSEETRA